MKTQKSIASVSTALCIKNRLTKNGELYRPVSPLFKTTSNKGKK